MTRGISPMLDFWCVQETAFFENSWIDTLFALWAPLMAFSSLGISNYLSSSNLYPTSDEDLGIQILEGWIFDHKTKIH